MITHSFRDDDSLRLARLHQASFPDFFLARLGERFLVQFYLGYVGDPSAVIAVARDRAGEPLGIAVGTTDPDGFFARLLRRRLRGFAWASIVASLSRPSVAHRLVRAITYRGDNPPGVDGALLSSICVDPLVSGNGIGSELLRAWLWRAREMGADRAFLTTDAVGNDSVNAWYVREGWALNDQYLSHGERAMNRYVFDLERLGAEL